MTKGEGGQKSQKIDDAFYEALVEVGSEPVFIFVKQNHSEADEIKGEM